MSVTSTGMTINAHFNDGPHSGTEHFEAWLRSVLADPDLPESWVKKADVVVGGVPDLAVPVTGLLPGIPYDVATRLSRSGAAQAGSTSSDPDEWPAGHQQAAVAVLLDDPVDDGSFVGDALGAPGVSTIWLALQLTPSDANRHENLFFEVEVDTGTGFGPFVANNGFYNGQLGTWGEIAHAMPYGDLLYIDVSYTGDSVLMNPVVEGYAGQTIDVRVRRVTKDGDLLAGDGTILQTSAWLVIDDLVVPA